MPEPRMETCFICGKPKGQPPERCNGHYEGTVSDPVREEDDLSLIDPWGYGDEL